MRTQPKTAMSIIGSPAQGCHGHYRRPPLVQVKESSQYPRSAADGGLNAAAFKQLLCWLGPDPETAGRKYESIRERLIMMFRGRRCVFAEDLADTTFERVARKLTDLTVEFTGDPARYFYGVAKRVYLEYQREITAHNWRPALSLSTNSDNSEMENLLDQLDEALFAIPESDRELILRYYTGSGMEKIKHRQSLAREFGIGPNALRLRVFRIRKEIKSHMSQFREGPPARANCRRPLLTHRSSLSAHGAFCAAGHTSFVHGEFRSY